MAGKTKSENLNGLTNLEKVKLLAKSPIKVDPDFKMPDIKIQEHNSSREYYCTCCGKCYKKQVGNFYKSINSILWKGNNGYIPICKSCSEVIYNGLIKFYNGNEEHALHRWCEIFDYPYDEEASAMTAAQGHVITSKISLYPSKINTIQVRNRGLTYFDTIKKEAGETERIRTANDLVEPSDDDSGFIVTKAITKKWGYGHKPEEYEWLEEKEEDWRSRVDCKSKPQEELIRMICLSQLNIQNCQQNGSKITEAMKAFQDLLASCNLQPRQNTSNEDFIEQNTFGTMIRMVENERPVAERDPEWEDVDGIKNYIDTYVYGHLAKVAHIENENADKYNAELAKYTVTRPDYYDDENSQETSLLDKIIGDKGDSNDERT